VPIKGLRAFVFDLQGRPKAVAWALTQRGSHSRVMWSKSRALLLGARTSIEAAPRVAELMARELKRDGDWQKQTVRNFKQVAQGYVPPA
jgi:glycerol-3-phosphate dehydrogenase